MADEVMHILEEIDESLQAEKLEEFWKRFGNWVIAGCAGIVFATAASVVWKNHMQETHARQTSILLGAQTLIAAGKYPEAVDLLKTGDTGTGSLRQMAGILRAEALNDAGKTADAQSAYTEAAKLHGDAALSDFAALEGGVLGSDTKGGAPADLSVASGAGSPYRFTAEEITAAGLIQSGKGKQAALLLNSLANDADAPDTLRSRAMELLATVSKESP